MKIDISDILCGKRDRLEFSYELPVDADTMAVLPPDDINVTCPIRVTGVITDNAGYTALTAEAEIEFETECARCLCTTVQKFSIEFNRTVALPNQLTDDDNDEYVIVEDGALDISEPLVEELFLQLPTMYLCREDCAGLCQKCGKNLNNGDCGCAEVKEINPKLAILQKLLEK